MNDIYRKSILKTSIKMFGLILIFFSCDFNKKPINQLDVENYPNDLSYFDLGKKFLYEEKYEEAVKCFNKAIEMSPHIAVLYVERAIAESHLKNYNRALKDLEKATMLNPYDLSIVYEKGLIESEAGLYEKALSDFNFICDKNPNFTDIYISRGSVKIKMGLKMEACEDFYKAQKLNSANADIWIKKNCKEN